MIEPESEDVLYFIPSELEARPDVPASPSHPRNDPRGYRVAAVAEWARFAAAFGGGGEVRCAGASQDAGLWLREFDKDSSWGRSNGLRSMLITALQHGVLGYPLVLPDMVGGNAYSQAMLEGGGDGGGTGGGTELGPPRFQRIPSG